MFIDSTEIDKFDAELRGNTDFNSVCVCPCRDDGSDQINMAVLTPFGDVIITRDQAKKFFSL